MLCAYRIPMFVLTLALAGTVLPQADGQILATYSPDVSATVDAPLVGLAATDDDYLLIHLGDWATLPKGFTGDTQEDVQFTNPSSAQDAASFNNEYMFQLGTDNNLFMVNLSTGAQTPFNNQNSINLGQNTFGIGYDAGTDTLGIGRFDGAQMTFRTYAVGTGVFSDPVSFAFDSAEYGTPTGLDYVVKDGAARMLVGTRDQQASEFSTPQNFILDMDAGSGAVGQFATITGADAKLQDLLYENSRLAVSFLDGSTGGIQVGDFTVIPEPRHAVVLAGVLALLAVCARRRRARAI